MTGTGSGDGLRDTALGYAARGWPVLACRPRAKTPLLEHGLHDPSTDPDQITEWWARWPAANIGLRTGVAFDALDVDGPEGENALPLDLAASDTLDGPTVATGKGWHVYVTATGLGNKAGLVPHVDWRGTGGYVIAPPSIHPCGAVYRWELPDDPTFGPEAPLRPAPGWLLELLEPTGPANRMVAPPCDIRLVAPAAPRLPAANTYGRKALESEVGRLALAPVGERNDDLYRAAIRLGQLVYAGQLEAGEVVDALLNVGGRVGLAEREVEATVRSGMRFGMENPRK